MREPALSRVVLSIVTLLSMLCCVRAGFARQDSSPLGLMPGQEVRISVETLGVGGSLRPGEFAGIRLAVTDTASLPREVVVRMRIVDADGDTIVYQRAVALNEGRPVGVWLYGRMPWQLDNSTILTFTVNLATPTADGQLEIGRQIGALRATPGSQQAVVLDPHFSLAGVVGRRALGLEHYTQNINGEIVAVSSQEALRVIADLTPGGFPDQWEGWASFETIVWGQGDPQELEGELSAAALAEWVHRGGHLVIVAPAVANPWASPRNPLAAILPRAAPERIVGVDLNRYRALLTMDKAGATKPLPRSADIHRFVVFPEATVAEACPIISGAEGCVVVRRLVGVGMVTMVGIPLAEPGIATIVRADAFWNRILGRRADQLTPAEADTARGRIGSLSGASMSASVDAYVPELIATNRAASWGVLLALIVFATYWLLAGPVGFAILKSQGRERHSWLAFVLLAGLFTGVAWIGAGALRPKKAQEWHYTILDHVYGQPVQRARSFASILLPEYGEQTISLGESGTDSQWRQALTPWADPTADTGLSFPDSRDYAADVRNLTSLTPPARSTVKQFQSEWLGGPRWSMPAPVDADSKPRLTSNGVLTGKLTHDLPGALTDVWVILVAGQISEAEDIAETNKKALGRLRFRAFGWGRREPWDAGQTLDLGSYNDRSRSDIGALLRDLVPSVSLTQGVTNFVNRRSDATERRELAMSLFGLLQPPDYAQQAALGETAKANMRRKLTHTLDLGKWFTQPCIIVIGAVQDRPSPVPSGVDGLPFDGVRRPATGRTLVRWIYPLDAAPVRFSGINGVGAL